MKKGTKIILLVSTACIVMGLAICIIVGALFGGNDALANSVKDGKINGLVLPNIGWHVEHDDDEEWDNYGGTILKSGDGCVELGKVDTLDRIELSCGAVDLKIIESADQIVRLTNDSNAKVKYNLSEDKLSIRFKGKANYSGTVTLELPAELYVDKMKVEVGAGNVESEVKLCTEEFKLEVGAGKTVLSNIQSDEMKLEVGAGELVVEDTSVERLDAEVAMGQFRYTGSLLDEGKIELAMGEATLDLDDEESNYSVNASVGAGSIVVGNHKIANGFHDLSAGAGDKKLDIECAMGSVNVNFSGDSVF